MTRRRKLALTATAVLIAAAIAVLGATGVAEAFIRPERPVDVTRDIRSIDFQQEQGDLRAAAGTLRILTPPQSGHAAINGDTVTFLPNPYKTAEVSFQVAGYSRDDATETRVTTYLYRVTGLTHTDSPIHVARGGSATYEVARTFAGYPISNITLDYTADDQNRTADGTLRYGSAAADWNPTGVNGSVHIDYAAGTVTFTAATAFTGSFTYHYEANVGDQHLAGDATFTTDSSAPATTIAAVPPTGVRAVATARGQGTPVSSGTRSGSSGPAASGSPAAPAGNGDGGSQSDPTNGGQAAPTDGTSAGAPATAGGSAPATPGPGQPKSGNGSASTPANGAGTPTAGGAPDLSDPAQALGNNGPAVPREIAAVEAAAAQRAANAAAAAAGAGSGTGGSGGSAAGAAAGGSGSGAGDAGGSGSGAGGAGGAGAAASGAGPVLASTGSTVDPRIAAAAGALVLAGGVLLLVAYLRRKVAELNA